MALFSELDVYDDVTARSAAMNMALDEALLEQARRPLLRFYRWDHAALSFGYFGKFEDVAVYAAERDLVRRWTGGGIVFHGDDLTYTIAIPATADVFTTSSRAIYAAVHLALRDALIASGTRVELADGRDAALRRPRRAQRAVPTEACFAKPVAADVMMDGRKVAGAAHRRTRQGLLHQGSIQLAAGRVRPTGGYVDASKDLAAAFACRLSGECINQMVDARIAHRAQEIAQQKYGAQSWLHRR